MLLMLQHHLTAVNAALLQVFPLSEVAEAHKQVETEHTRGKVVLSIT
jgi:NADPH:quinone reductase-like Zn-dependent oxidoreductase